MDPQIFSCRRAGRRRCPEGSIVKPFGSCMEHNQLFLQVIKHSAREFKRCIYIYIKTYQPVGVSYVAHDHKRRLCVIVTNVPQVQPFLSLGKSECTSPCDLNVWQEHSVLLKHIQMYVLVAMATQAFFPSYLEDADRIDWLQGWENC